MIDDTTNRSFEATIKIWENCNDFIDLGIETHKKGKRIRDFLFLDSDFFRKNGIHIKVSTKIYR